MRVTWAEPTPLAYRQAVTVANTNQIYIKHNEKDVLGGRIYTTYNVEQ
jgi:hypothetical protein